MQDLLNHFNNTTIEHSIHQSVGLLLQKQYYRAKDVIVDALASIPLIKTELLKKGVSSIGAFDFEDEEDAVLNAALGHIAYCRTVSRCSEANCPKRESSKMLKTHSIT